jgi:hypothetical protein
MIKPMMKKIIKGVINQLAYHTATGKIFGDKAPSKQELEKAFSVL